ncbi:MAG: NTP transferase domain-containing protein [Rhodospirillales bacterium]|nr:NTP transferase domain-containing protein [Rhodospirillales bacterium]
MTTCLENVDVAVLAGGLGTRLAGVLGGTPKILAPIGDRPFLSLLLEWLRGFGAKRVIFGLGHLADQIEDYLGAHTPDGMECLSVIEAGPLGTAGAINNLMAEVRNLPLLVLNGDTFVDADICAFAADHRASGFAGSVLCTNVPDAGRYGTVDIDAGGTIRGFYEKSGQSAGGTINAGVYLFESQIMDAIAAAPGPSLERDVFEKFDPGVLHAYVGDFPFLDIGTPEDLIRAPQILAPYFGV